MSKIIVEGWCNLIVNQYIRFELKKATIIASVNLVDKKENKWRWEIDEYKSTGLVFSKEEAIRNNWSITTSTRLAACI
jgi:hypothetical protein